MKARFRTDLFTYDDLDPFKTYHPTIAICGVCEKFLEFIGQTEDPLRKLDIKNDYFLSILIISSVHDLDLELPHHRDYEIFAAETLRQYGDSATKLKAEPGYGAIRLRPYKTYGEWIGGQIKYIGKNYQEFRGALFYWKVILKTTAHVLFILSNLVVFILLLYFWYIGKWENATISVIYAILSSFLIQCFEMNPLRNMRNFLQWSFVNIVLAIYFFARVFEKNGLIYNNKPVHESWDSLYFSIVTWTTLGYGDFTPTENSRPWAVAEAVMGYAFTAILISFFVTSLLSRNKMKKV